MKEILEIIGALLVLLGGIFLFLGGLGIVRMPDAYNRLQAGTKATTLGGMSLILGVGLMETSWLIKAMVIIIFIAFSNPLSSHALARANYKRKNFPYLKNTKGVDAYKDAYLNENKEEQS